jgi:hypothetical protein
MDIKASDKPVIMVLIKLMPIPIWRLMRMI